MNDFLDISLDEGLKKKSYNPNILIVLTIILAFSLNQISQRVGSIYISRGTAILRSLIYFGLFISWGLSIRRRVMQKQVKAYLTVIALLMVLWLGFRSTKYFFVLDGSNFFRYLWYGYYIPELLIILMSLFITLSLGKPEDYRLPKATGLLYLPTISLIILVLTNDLHELVFKFGSGSLRNNISYSHQIGFWIVFAWLIICALTALIVVLTKSKVPRSNKIIWLPFLPLLTAIVYTFIYVFWFSLIKGFANDMTIVLCLLIISIFESCIYSGLIRTNKHYSELFYASNLAGLILDKDYQIHFKSSTARLLDKEILQAAEKGSVYLDENTQVSSLPITGGHMVWLEDISEINQILGKLKEIGESLLEGNELLQAEIDLKERLATVEEKERIYSRILEDIDPKLQIIEDLLLEEADKSMKDEEKLKWFGILVVYIKRRANLIILSEDSPSLYGKEIEYCFRESLEFVSECGIDTFFQRRCESPVATRQGILIYDIFQELLELGLPSMKSLLVNLRILKGEIRLKMVMGQLDAPIELADLKYLEELGSLGALVEEKFEGDSSYISIELGRMVVPNA